MLFPNVSSYWDYLDKVWVRVRLVQTKNLIKIFYFFVYIGGLKENLYLFKMSEQRGLEKKNWISIKIHFNKEASWHEACSFAIGKKLGWIFHNIAGSFLHLRTKIGNTL